MVVHSCDLNTSEVKTGGSLKLVYTLSQKAGWMVP